MTDADVTASIAQVDSMLDRVVKVIGCERPEKPLRPDVSYPRHKHTVNARPMVAAESKPPPRHHGGHVGYSFSPEVIASGSLTGNEMRISSPRAREFDDDPTGMWASFESDFDDMVAGMH